MHVIAATIKHDQTQLITTGYSILLITLHPFLKWSSHMSAGQE